MKKLVGFSIFLAFVVIMLGAYTRLTDAGLGCPDWPGCYGHLTVPKGEHVDAANQAFPQRPVEAHKAWNEMIHRYFAGTLGLVIVAIAAIALRNRQVNPVKLPLFLVGLVIFQAALGMWTVTLNLLPAVVMAHLLGGFAVLSCLFLLLLRLKHLPTTSPSSASRTPFTLALVGLAILVVQIGLGGWTSANYAALACTDFPICEGEWTQRLDFSDAFSIPEAQNYEFGAHDYDERMTMHVVHRFGAIVTFLYLLWFAIKVAKVKQFQFSHQAAALLVVVLGIQIALGISNIVFSLPLSVAVLHNAVAATLLLVMVWITFHLHRLQGGHYE
ncbi:COX15/CtaA family protein [Alteromonas sp. ASW11-130]|uniref:COX15/CtaA family protein n=1 Tax=Alteromonas sp. ASW11-130 TaxID=3015775 RepID=UPI0022425FFC|nr:COX15/CtaA family protein [Alteromonas sp. ASW11-130]MCW8093329.1 COX15/CtaA family protein [Alteromonas sp. ASW11-130]